MIELSNDSGATWRTLDSFGLILQPGHSSALIPQARERKIQIPGKAGVVYFGAEISERSFNLPLAFPYETSARFLQQKAREFTVFLTDGTGKPRELWMKFDYDPDKFYKVYYAGELGIERQLSMGFFTLPLIAYDPFAYQTQTADELYSLDSDVMLDNDILLDGDEFTFTITEETTVQVNNIGTLNVAPVIEVTGTFDTLEIGELSYNEALAAGTLTIDNAKMTVKVGSTNKLGKLSGDFIELIPGINNITITGTALNCTVSFIYRPKYL